MYLDTGCEYEGKTYNSTEQVPRSHPCDFCFCFRGDIICLQQTCPPPVPHCFETVIEGFCCPRYECRKYKLCSYHLELILLVGKETNQPTKIQLSAVNTIRSHTNSTGVAPQNVQDNYKSQYHAVSNSTSNQTPSGRHSNVKGKLIIFL